MKLPFQNNYSNKRYLTYDYYLKERFGVKCCKISLDAGFSCPNIDGTKSFGGCTFCSSRGSGDFCADSKLSIQEQFFIQKERLQKKWPEAKYIPYFQAHTNTYAPLDVLIEKYNQALTLPDCVGLSIATRPDCLSPEVIAYLKELTNQTYLTIELGLQSIFDKTLKHINRGHTYQDFLNAYKSLEGIPVCIHIINGLPGETPEMMKTTAREIAKLHPHAVKIHMLHILKNTPIAREYENGTFPLLSREEYISTVCSQIELFSPDTVIERVTGDGAADSLIAPLWTQKKFTIMNDIDKEFISRNSFQGKYYL